MTLTETRPAEVRSDYLAELGERLRSRHADEMKYVVTLLEEAQFGHHVASGGLASMRGLGRPTRVLEIGAGAFILSSWLAAEGHDVTAMEPLGVGFGALKRIQDSVLEFAREKGVVFNISTDFMEKHAPAEPYDFAFAINVFEHIDKIDDAFSSVAHLVKPGGVVRAACPNYHVPYESHYGLPIVVNGPLTRKLFDKYINAFDRENDCKGLWDSLNFITSTQAARCAQRAGLRITFDKGVIEYMLARFDRPSAFTRRHSAIGGFARTVNALKLSRALKLLPMQVQPYMVFDLAVAGGRALP